MLFQSSGIDSVFRELGTSDRGLSRDEAVFRFGKFGANEIRQKKVVSPLKIFFDQFKSFIVGILFVAVVVSLLVGEWIDALVIGVILLINAVLGFVQEFRAERAIEALRGLVSLKAVVVRDGVESRIDAKELVPGDIIVLETGDRVPADARLIECVDLEVMEASLTGESVPSVKGLELSDGLSIADQGNMVFSFTIITKGRGKGVVVRTGMDSEVGRIADMIQNVKPVLTPLQLKFKSLGEVLGVASIVVCVIVFFVGVLFGNGVSKMLLVSLSLAVAAIPEGLPAIVTISLALGVQRLVKRNVLVRKLSSVETLGSTNVICTDKTGTLTHNEMTVRKLFVNGKVFDVGGSGYKDEGVFSLGGKVVDPVDFRLLLEIGALCNDAKLSDAGVVGDPTEAALLVSAAKGKVNHSLLSVEVPRIGEIQFSSERKRMSTFHSLKGKSVVFSKGAPDVVLELCDRVLEDGMIRRLTREDKRGILDVNDGFASEALRVLGFAFKESDKLDEDNLVFVGLQGMIDPPREEAKLAIAKCNAAGIKVVMITGDHKRTAEAVASELGLVGRAVDGKELDSIVDLGEVVDDIVIYARVDPRHKLRIVEAFKSKGYVVAMTGDGVNDAPALKRADMGVAMGISGTDVAKEASDMVLTDDNFVSIINAVEEGRTIFDNIKIFIKYLLVGNVAGILAVVVSLVVGLPLPLLALQILWFNLVTETIPSIALTREPPEKDVMTRKPRRSGESFILRGEVFGMVVSGIIMTVGVLGIFYFGLVSKGWVFGEVVDLNNLPGYYLYATTLAFSALVLFQLFNVFNMKSPNSSIFFEELFNNKWLLLAVFVSLALQFVVVYSPLGAFFHTVALSFRDWLLVFLVSSSVLVYGELDKFVRKIRSKSGSVI